MNTTTNIYVVHTYNKHVYNTSDTSGHKFQGVYSSKEIADAAGTEYCETWGPETLHFTVIIAALDDIINGVHKSELTS